MNFHKHNQNDKKKKIKRVHISLGKRKGKNILWQIASTFNHTKKQPKKPETTSKTKTDIKLFLVNQVLDFC